VQYLVNTQFLSFHLRFTYGLPPGGTCKGGYGLLPSERSSESLELESAGSEFGFGVGERDLGDGVLQMGQEQEQE
jgi:hypothetical protein